MHRILTLLAALFALSSLMLAATATAQDDAGDSDIVCSYDAYNCSDFRSCSQVMRVFEACERDVHGLDGDNDGIPCESLCD